MLDLQMAEPEAAHSVVRFKVAFPGTPKSYSYAAIKAGREWWITGRDGASGRSWEALLKLLTRDNATITSAQLATSLEDL